ncbi:DUF4192 domain-containing protein [Streptomyces polyrhachis]|uniref:DUF4192 domain-containing protein n=1 Tax=Streptomyces polyrhachis TaxID=1282885 RepID=A0ABW2GCU2_9ACTN
MEITLRSPAELADALPYLMGFHPTDSIVMVALKGERGTFGGRLRLGIPTAREEWSDVAQQLADCLIEGSRTRGADPTGVIVFLCQDPAAGPETPAEVMERLRPLAQRLRVACGRLDVPVIEALCISAERYWSYCCPDARCCPPQGTALAARGTTPMAAAATYAGIRVCGSLREMEARLSARPEIPFDPQTKALDAAGAALIPRIVGAPLGDGPGDGLRDVVTGRGGDAGVAAPTARGRLGAGGAPHAGRRRAVQRGRGPEVERRAVRRECLALAERLLVRLAGSLPAPAASDEVADAWDDALIGDDEAAALIIGLQDRITRDRAAEWMEEPDAAPALRLWRALARRCVGAYGEHAAAPLTLAGWVAWSAGDETGARVCLARALELDPAYAFAGLLHQAVNEGLDPEPLRRSLRRSRGRSAGPANRSTAPDRPGGAGPRRRGGPSRGRRRSEDAPEGR